MTYVCVHSKSLQLCPTLCDPMDCSPPCSSVLGILRVRILEWVAISSSRGLSQPENKPVSPAGPALQAVSLPLSYQEALHTHIHMHTHTHIHIHTYVCVYVYIIKTHIYFRFQNPLIIKLLQFFYFLRVKLCFVSDNQMCT